MVWGTTNQLIITISRAGFWDHRGGNEFAAKTTYQDVKRLLRAGDYKGITKAFAIPKTGDQGFGHPQQLGGGRLEITMPDGWTLTRGELDMGKGEITVSLIDSIGTQEQFRIGQAANRELAWIQYPAIMEQNGTWINSKHFSQRYAKLVPAFEAVSAQLTAVGIQKPFIANTVDNFGIGLLQELPRDSALSIYWGNRGYGGNTSGRTLTVSTALVSVTKPRINQLYSTVSDASKTTQFWADYWQSVPKIILPDPALQEIVDYGLYKQACVTPPQGVAATLQGPFMEDYQVPPWSNDYHFNINAEMIYWPALATNRLSHFEPLWRMMRGWMPILRKNGESFFGRKGALMLPHAVDDRGHVVGTFWTGTIDQACTAWMAQMAWQHYRYGIDQPNAQEVLEGVAWPLLVGAFEGYYAMLEEVTDPKAGAARTKRFSLPISVSPEYGGDGPNAWGRDASFQLAALHRICRILPAAARAMNQPIDPRWADVDARLPPYTTVSGVFMSEWNLSNERIGLWRGKDLDGSHRHHSHLAGIYPFATIDLNDPTQRKIVDNSLAAWRFRGAGGWTGWCVPWASIILSRTGQADAAVNWLHYWKDNFTNEGRGTLHNANTEGHSLIGAPDWTRQAQNREVMQLDGGFGALNAVLELLVQSRDDGVYVLPNLPRTWRELTFDRIRTEGAFQIGATVRDGQVQEIRVTSLANESLRLIHGLGETYRINGQPASGNQLQRICKAGEVLVLTHQ